MKKVFVLTLLISSVAILNACQKTPEVSPENRAQEGIIEVVDPKAEAEAQLLEELGLESAEIEIQKDTLEFPSVLPTPPALPATDADIIEISE